jgi:transposase
MGRSRGGPTSKIHAVVDCNGLPVRLALTAGEAHDNRLAAKLLSCLKSGSMLLADRGYDADWIRALLPRKASGPIFRRDAIATTRSASAHISTGLATWSNASSTSQTVSSGRNSLRQTRRQLPCLHPACVHQAMACALMSPRPRR